MAEKLLPCPFCGAGQTTIHVNKGTWNGRSFGEPSSVEVRHWCEQTPGQPSRMLSRVGRDEASAIAAWNKRAQHAGEAGEPVAWIQQDRGNTVVVWRESPKKFDVGTKFYVDPAPAKKCIECNGLGTSAGRDGALIPCFACDGKGFVAAPAAAPQDREVV